MNNFKKILISLAASTAIVSAASAITWSAAVDGLTVENGSFSSAGSAPSGSVVLDTKNGVTFVGVTRGVAGTEIDEGQMLTIKLDTAMIYQSLTLGLLFNGPEYNDDIEIAAATADGLVTYTLSIIAENTAVWSFGGATVTNLLPTKLNKGGVFEIVNPFGNLSIKDLTLTAVSNGAKGKSDFGLVAFEVPDTSSTLSLLGLSILVLGFVARRRK